MSRPDRRARSIAGQSMATATGSPLSFSPGAKSLLVGDIVEF